MPMWLVQSARLRESYGVCHPELRKVRRRRSKKRSPVARNCPELEPQSGG